MLTLMREEIHRWPDDKTPVDVTEPQLEIPATEQGVTPMSNQSRRKVFVIFGHNLALKDQVVNYLYRVKLEPVLLNEQAGGGRTLIQMLHDNRDVGFAIAILSADDVGTAAGEYEQATRLPGDSADDTSAAAIRRVSATLRPRARQNVIFELGLFQGFHGQGGVCVILGKDKHGRRVERPSDLEGIRYLPVEGENGMGLLGLLRGELIQAGLDLDRAAN